MIKNAQKLEQFNRKIIERENLSHQQALAIYQLLHDHAVRLKAISSENIMDGLEVDIRIARALNGLAS